VAAAGADAGADLAAVGAIKVPAATDEEKAALVVAARAAVAGGAQPIPDALHESGEFFFNSKSWRMDFESEFESKSPQDPEVEYTQNALVRWCAQTPFGCCFTCRKARREDGQTPTTATSPQGAGAGETGAGVGVTGAGIEEVGAGVGFTGANDGESEHSC
jgi:hypothetical protein